MRVFISWSGSLSRELGEVFRAWLPATLQFVKPYFTPADVEKGARWDSEISRELAASDVGVLCLTRAALDSDWILFEAGALSKQLDQARVCPLLFNLDASDLSGPLSRFQATVYGKEEMFQLLRTINEACDESERLQPDVLHEVFETWWPKLEEKVADVFGNASETDDVEIRSQREILEEVLETVRVLTRRRAEDIPDVPRQLSLLTPPIEKIVERIVERPLKRRPPATRNSLSHAFNVSGHVGSITVDLYGDGNPCALMLRIEKGGSTIGGLMDAFATSVTQGLQYGVPIESMVQTFTHSRFEPAGMTDNRDIPFAKSLVDYVFRWLGMEFIPGYREANAPKRAASRGHVNPKLKADDMSEQGKSDAAANDAQ